MNKKLILTLAVAAVAGLVMARPGPGGFHHGGFHHGGFGGPRGGFHHGGFGGPRYHHHHYHSGWGWGLGAAGLALGTAAIVRDIVAPRPVVYSSYGYGYGYGTPVYTTYPGTYVAPAVYPTTVVSYPPPPPPPPPPVVYPRW